MTTPPVTSLPKSGLDSRANLVLIGLPGCGKSTMGERLAQCLGWPFIDTDRVVEALAGMTLQQIMDRQGVEQLRTLEARAVCGLNANASVIATGGSVVYSDSAMQHLASNGLLVYLRAREETIRERLGDYAARGIVRLPGQSLSSVIQERMPLYEHYADRVIDVDGLTVSEVSDACLSLIGRTLQP